jgi:hypothetical protein
MDLLDFCQIVHRATDLLFPPCGVFHEESGLSLTIAGESLFRNKIPSTLEPRRLLVVPTASMVGVRRRWGHCRYAGEA